MSRAHKLHAAENMKNTPLPTPSPPARPRLVQQRLGSRPTYTPRTPALQPAASKRSMSDADDDAPAPPLWRRRSEALATTAAAQHCNGHELAEALLHDRTSWLGAVPRDMLRELLLPLLPDDTRPARPGLMRLPSTEAPPRMRLLPALPADVEIYPYDGIDVLYSNGADKPRMTLYSLQFGVDKEHLPMHCRGSYHPSCVLLRGG